MKGRGDKHYLATPRIKPGAAETPVLYVTAKEGSVLVSSLLIGGGVAVLLSVLARL